MTPESVLAWASSLLKQFSLQLRAGEKVYHIELQNDFMSLTACKNTSGEAEDLFLDDETRAKKQLDATRLDGGINLDEE